MTLLLMVNDMVERVARALWETGKASEFGGWQANWDSSPMAREDLKDHYRALARAAIAAMRDPTEEINDPTP